MPPITVTVISESWRSWPHRVDPQNDSEMMFKFIIQAQSIRDMLAPASQITYEWWWQRIIGTISGSSYHINGTHEQLFRHSTSCWSAISLNLRLKGSFKRILPKSTMWSRISHPNSLFLVTLLLLCFVQSAFTTPLERRKPLPLQVMAQGADKNGCTDFQVCRMKHDSSTY